jgi:hypothetical protein
MKPETVQNLADDLLEGAPEIAEFIFGSRGKREVRKVYHWLDLGVIPATKAGNKHISTRSAITARLTPRLGQVT